MKIHSRKLVFIKLAVIAAVAAAVFGIYQFFPATYSKVSASANGPSPSHTDAPGETNCTACHSDFPVNSGTGSVLITGVPAYYVPNQSYTITVKTSQEDAVVYGFQLTAIDNLGRRAGTLTPPTQATPQMQIVSGIVGANTRQYIEHTEDGIAPVAFGSKSWTFTWTAPAQRVGRIGFYAGGNAANSDGSSAGDYIYTTSRNAIASTTSSDFDGDGKTDISIFRPAPGEWWYLKSSNGGNGALQFGATSDKLAAKDYTGDGKTDIAFWRPSTGQWFILRSEDNSFYSFPFGASGDIPVPADYDDDGKADAAVFRPSTTTWFISKSSGGTQITQFGAAGDIPAVGDYDGDGKSDFAIFRPAPGEWWVNRSSDGSTFALQFGSSTDKPVQGDYTGDGKTDIGFWRPSNGNWYILRSEDSSFYSFPFGANGDTPAPGDYDGDRKTDAAVFRSSNFTWFINKSSGGTQITQFGISGDVPVPGYAP
jgi:hypothetical protein